MNVGDNLYLGSGFTLGATSGRDPTQEQGCGPMGRVAHLNIVPATKVANNLALVQALAAAVALAITVGAGVTLVPNFQGGSASAYALDVPRCVALTSASDLSAINFTLVAYDQYGQRFTNTIAGPNATTVIFPKAAKWVVSITPAGTSVNTVTAGTSDTFGLPFAISDAGYITSLKWAGALATDAGVLTLADTTNPATATTGDPRGTYAPSTASDAARRLVIAMHLTDAQCGVSATRAGAIGVTPA